MPQVKLKVSRWRWKRKSYIYFHFSLLHKCMHCAFLSISDSTFAASVIPKGEVIIVIIAVVIINDELFIWFKWCFFCLFQEVLWKVFAFYVMPGFFRLFIYPCHAYDYFTLFYMHIIILSNPLIQYLKSVGLHRAHAIRTWHNFIR